MENENSMREIDEVKANKSSQLHKYARKGIDQTKTVELRQKGLTVTEIAKIQGCDHSNIVYILQKYGLSKQDISDYKDNRADIYAGLQSKIISAHLTEERIKTMPPAVAPLWFNSLFNNERLERNQSTGNISLIERKITEIQSLDPDE